MRAKHFILILCCVLITTIIIVLGPAGEPNDSLKSIVSHTHEQFNKLQENLRVAEKKKLEVDPKYLAFLGFSSSQPTKESQYYKYSSKSKGSDLQQQSSEQQLHNTNNEPDVIERQHLPLQNPATNVAQQSSKTATSSQKQQHHSVTSTPFNGIKANFSIVTYVLDGQAPSAILLAQNVAAKFPNENLFIYDLGLSEEDSRALNAYCNNSKCSVIGYDLTLFPSHVAEKRMYAYRPIVIKDALMRSRCILFTENYMRLNGSSQNLLDLQNKAMISGVLGWSISTAVSAHTHPRMFDYFQTDATDFYFLRQVDLDAVLFVDNLFVTEKIMLPWIKCALTLECIDPIGAQSNGCKYNKKPQYRYSGCHGYDISAFNIVLGLTWHFDVSKYSLPKETLNIFYNETLEQATKTLEIRRRNSSETSDHPFTDE